jgi:hypothetical protein
MKLLGPSYVRHATPRLVQVFSLTNAGQMPRLQQRVRVRRYRKAALSIAVRNFRLRAGLADLQSSGDIL